MRWKLAVVWGLLVVGLGVGVVGASARSVAVPPSVRVEVIGKGKVTGTGISCGLGTLGCFASYGSAAAVSLTAAAAAGWSFVGWEDDASCGAASMCVVTPGSPTATATAVFSTTGTVQTATLSVSVGQDAGGATHGTVSNGPASNYPLNCGTGGTVCSLSTLLGSTVSLSQTADSGYLFSGWGGSCAGSGQSCSVYLSADKGVGANFVAPTATTLSVKVDGSGRVSGGGISCGPGSACDASESAAGTVTLTATPESGYAFTGWGGDCSGLQPTCTLQTDTDRSVTASFAPLVPILTTVNGNGEVFGPNGISCGPGPTSCPNSVPPNQTIQLTAKPGPGSSVSWTGCTSAAGTTCNLVVGTSPVSVTATFSGGPPPPSSFTVAVDVGGNGYVTSSGGSSAIYCTAAGGQGCAASLAQNTTLTLTAVPASGATGDFSGWTGDCASATSTTCTLTVNGAKSVGATFAGSDLTYILTAQLKGTGTGTITGAGLHCSATGSVGCSAAQAASATVTITASPLAGSTFDGWSGACSGTATTCRVSMSAAKDVTATFTAPAAAKPTLTITVVGAGKVKTSAGECKSTAGKTTSCVQQYTAGTRVTLTATPATGSLFTGWKGACSGKNKTCTITLTTAQAATATFQPQVLTKGKKPTVEKLSSGYRITLFYKASQSGNLKLIATRSGARALIGPKQIKPGNGKLTFTLKRPGRYLLTLTLTTKSGRHTIRWTLTI